MAGYDEQTLKQLKSALVRIERSVYTPVAAIEARAWRTPEPVPFTERTTGQEIPIRIRETWGRLWDCAWFHFTGTVPGDAEGRRVVLLIDLSGEGCVVDAQGTPVLGLTTVSSEFDFSLGRPGKRVVSLLDTAGGGEPVDLWVDAACNDLFGKYQDSGVLKEAHIAICNEQMHALSYDFSVLHELMTLLPRESARHQRILAALTRAERELCCFSEQEAARARRHLAPELAKRGGTPSLTLSAIGHAHIDLAWLWPLRETIRKAGRTFATALALLERYPAYRFGASQAQLYQWVKDFYPALYTKVKEQIAAGRWEVQGAMWVEPDTNLPGGEALVRQLLYGRRFFREEFGRVPRTGWLPDAFGYSGALPQLLKKSGVDYFMTTKMSWNLVNGFPHHTFYWEGIDGSQVLCHMPPEGTYNSSAAPRALLAAENGFADKQLSEHALLLFGIGDGGGGPGEEHIERLLREEDLAGLPPVVQELSEQFFDRIAAETDAYSTWVGELYLERHQGTYTSQARNKRANRKLEIALRELEWIAVPASKRAGYRYPAAALARIWKELLLYQFHDILPGSSISRVYDESLARYAALLEETQALTAAARSALLAAVDTQTATEPAVVMNSLSWTRDEWVQLEGRWRYVSVPALGYTVVDWAEPQPMPANLVATPGLLENDKLRIQLAPDGTIVSLYDKEHDREVVAAGEPANALTLYQDGGDAWDISTDYATRPCQQATLLAAEAQVDGPRAVLRHSYQLGASRLDQQIVLTAGSRRLDFITTVDWRERGRMLRTRFPLAVHATEATYDIQFGSIKRPTHMNTNWDLAKFEVCGQKWADVSQADYGVALLNDCKYGYSVARSVISLNLLRSPGHPDPVADRATHEFTYAVYPHAGEPGEGGVMRAGYELNVPLAASLVDRHDGTEPGATSFFHVDAANVVIEAVKQAEAGDDVMVRMYESQGRSIRTRVHSAFRILHAREVDLMEENERDMPADAQSVDLAFGPYEIRTLRLTV